MNRTNLTRRSTLAILAAAAGASSLEAQAQGKDAPAFQAILDGAKAEGRVVVWASFPSSTPALQALSAAFNKRFGLSTKVEWLPIAAVAANTRAIAESISGKVGVDIIGGAAADELYSLKSRGLLAPFPWAETFGAQLPAVGDRANDVIPELRGYALAYCAVVYCLIYNPTMIEEAQLPLRISDLTDPKWKGKVAWNSFNLTPMDFLSYAQGPQFVQDLAKKIIDNRPVLEPGTPSVTRAVSSGTVPLGVANATSAGNAIRNGEPIKMRVFSDYVPVSQLHLYVPNNSPNPNTARLFAAWLASEGLSEISTIEPLWRASDPKNPIFPAIQAQENAGAKVVRVQTVAQLDTSVALREKIAELVNSAR